MNALSEERPGEDAVALVHLQEEDPTRHEQLAKDSESRLMRLRERFLIDAPKRDELEILNNPQHRDLMALIRSLGEETA